MSQDIDARRSTAAQFFMDDDSEEQKSSYNKIVDWLNSAAVTTENKVDFLRKVQEIIINKEESLLDNFLEEVLGFQNDRSPDVRKFIVGFIEEACKKDPDVLPRVVANLAMLLKDESVPVQKRVVQAACAVYRCTLQWLAHARTVTEEMEATWNIVCAIKGQIFGLVDSDNDGLRTQAIKLLESVVLMQTYPEADSLRRDNDFSLEDVPLTLKIARRRRLEEEAHMVFELMLKFHGSMHISSVNLMTCMGSIALIAKMRPQFMAKVVSALETLNANLPPTLSKSQVSSVRKHLKLQLLNLLRLPSSVPFHNTISTMLSDLGATSQEVMKCLPRVEELRRRQKRLAAAAKADATSTASSGAGPPLAKRPRIDPVSTVTATVVDEDEYDEDDDDEPNGSEVVSGAAGSVSAAGGDDIRPLRPATEQAVDITEQFIVERLSPEMAAQLVIVSMSKLPDTMPPHFSSMYTPIAAAGTQSQIRHVARLMATQLTTLGLGPGAARQLVKSAVKGSLMEEDEEEPGGTKASIASALSGIMEKDKEAVKSNLLVAATNAKLAKQRLKTLKLSEITKPLEPEQCGQMLAASVQRILRAGKPALLGGVAAVRNKIITTVAATYDDLVRREVLYFLLEDIRTRLELALAWLYEEYAFLQGFNRMPAFLRPDPEGPERSYNDLLCALARHLIEKADARDRDQLLNRLYLEAPLITEEATDLLRSMCLDEMRAAAGLALLRELVTRRPPRQLVFLNALLVHTAHENTEIRSRAISCVVALYDRGDLRCIIEEYAILYLGFLRLAAPPDVLFGPDRGRLSMQEAMANIAAANAQGAIGPDGTPASTSGWTEEMVRACLYLYLALLPVNEKLIHELARVYVTTVADVKRTILRLLEQPVRGMGMDSPELLRLVEECPKGAETLVTRVIHILTDKTPPSVELVARVRDLYHSRVADVRFLIPVLNGLSKKEVVAALPKLIKLNPVVVKEVFNRLLGTHNEASSHTSPLTPAELLIALHTIDPSKCELKTIIKATSLCFAERQAYTQEVLAVVMQHLMELNPLPTLLMRTVIQALSFYPRLIGFVMNILQRLILKQVWKQRKVWEGFVKCCQRTRPQSFQVLLQLPPAQLCDVFEASPDLRAPLLQHVMSFTENQRAHIPPSIMDVLLGKRRTVTEEYDEQVEPRSPSELTIDIKDDTESEPAPPGLE